VGSLLTWADRVVALVEAEDFIEAINLTSSYYNGKSEKITLGLPENDDERHSVVQDKLTEMIIASLKYTFSHKPESTDNYVHAEIVQQKLVKDLTAACINACMSMEVPMFLFDDVYEIFEDYGQIDVFIDVLEPYILKDQIQDIPPSIMKDITLYFVGRNLHQRLEQLICHINPARLDIDQITTICRQHGLYDALSYVYNNALKDYITPMVEFVNLVRYFFNQHSQHKNTSNDNPSITFDAFKVFPYISYILTGRVYPTGEDMSDSDSHEAKQSIYYFLFSGRTLSWPRDRGQLIRTTNIEESEPTFPYLRLLLRFDAPTLFQAMDEAFEDRFLNGTNDQSSPSTTNGLESFGRAINRQFIINIFLEVMSSEFPSDIIYLYMFIARNLPKYPQFILLSGSTIEGILLRLCTYGETEMAEEAQLATEYLLSVFKPGDSEKMIQAYQEAKFYRVLKSTLRGEGRYTELLDVYLLDDDKLEVFDCVDGLLRGGSVLNLKQRDAVKGFLLERLVELVEIDTPRTADIFERFVTERQKEVVLRLQGFILFVYLDTIISQLSEESVEKMSWIDLDVRELYISLMCEFRPADVTRYLETLGVDDIRIEKILPALEKYNVIDGIVMILRRAGMTKEAMQKVVVHIASLQCDLSRTLQNPGLHSEAEALVSEVGRFAFVGADLCETFSKGTMVKAVVSKKGKEKVTVLNDAELMWLTLLETVVGITRKITTIVTGKEIDRDESHVLDSLRVVVQDIFTKLLTLTSSTTSSPNRPATTIQVSFISILRRFLQNLGSSPLTDLRSVVSSIFDAYRYERQLIQITSKLIEADLFQDLLRAKQEREKGWRPTSANCMACGRILFGPGAKGNIFAKWEQLRLQATEKKMAQDEARRHGIISTPATPNGKGKGKSVDLLPSPIDIPEVLPINDIEGDIVIFGCGHAYHRICFAQLGGSLQNEGDGSLEGRPRCFVCESH
jgi:vacuolar protein sorting-associated protein 8